MTGGLRAPACHVAAPRPATPSAARPSRAALELHRRLDGYRPTPLVALPEQARELGLGELLVKVESERFGLPAFKVLGASWAVYRRALEHLGARLEGWRTQAELRRRCEPLRPLELVTATDGNHGRGVARVARWLGLDAHVFVPHGTAPARRAAIEGEGARVTVVDGDYDATVERAAAAADGPRAWLIQDTAWPGYEDVPRRVVEGYATLSWEIEDELARRGESWPDLVLVPVGVGSLAMAVVQHLRGAPATAGTCVIGVEPTDAACGLASLAAGRSVTVPGPHRSRMVGLNCGTLSSIAWPVLRDGLDGALTASEAHCAEAVRRFARAGLALGESGASGLAGWLALAREASAAPLRERVGEHPRLLVFATEGVTDPESHAALLAERTA